MNDENHYTAPDGKRYVAVEADYASCQDCTFYRQLCPTMPGCLSHKRQDGRNIIWKLETKETK